MKNLPLRISIILNVALCIVVFWCCRFRNHDRGEVGQTGQQLVSASAGQGNVYAVNGNYDYPNPCDANGTSKCENCYAPVCCDSPLTCISACFAKRLVQLYKTNHWTPINTIWSAGGVVTNNGTQKKDSRAVWFSLKKLKRFIYEIERKTCQLPALGKPDLGIRLYFGEYPVADEWKNWRELRNWADYANEKTSVPANDEYSKLHTMVLVATYNDGHNNVDFDPNTGRLFSDPKFLAECKTMDDTVDTAEGPLIWTPQLQNHGDMVPPPFTVPPSYTSMGATFMDFADH